MGGWVLSADRPVGGVAQTVARSVSHGCSGCKLAERDGSGGWVPRRRGWMCPLYYTVPSGNGRPVIFSTVATLLAQKHNGLEGERLG